MVTQRAARWVDDRVGAAGWVSKALGKVFPDHFSFMLGEVAAYCFVTLVLTGVFLTFFFEPSQRDVVYHGHYAPLVGQHMSAAYQSAVRLSFDVRSGLVIRQMHHWAALIFAAAIVAHLCRIFFTGAFRRPRELNWMIGVTLLLLVIANGFAGYSLLDDLLSGTGLRVAYSIAESIPLVGSTAATWVFGGEYPADSIISRLFVIHVLVLPALIVGLLSIHLALVWRQKHTQFREPAAEPPRTEANVVGTRLWPTYTAKSLSMLFSVLGVIGLLGGLVQINPIWLYGRYEPATVSVGAQPDWYMGWLEGALRLMPPWEIRALGHTIPNVFFPGALMPGLTFLALYTWPFLERRFTGDHREHHLLDRPRDRPVRTALGLATFTFYAVLFVAGSDDVVALRLHVSVNAMVVALRTLLFVLPVAVGLLSWKWCRDLAAGDEERPEAATERAEAVPPERAPESTAAASTAAESMETEDSTQPV